MTKNLAIATDPQQLARTPHLATHAVVREHGEQIARQLYDAFLLFNAHFFEGKLAPPLVLITQAASARTLGDYVPRDVHGLESRIRIAPRTLQRGLSFVYDVLLHEMVHAWAHEVLGDVELGYRGHGPKFAEKCNKISDMLGLPHVGVRNRSAGLPDCAHWPGCVRPSGYYPEDWKPPTRGKKQAVEPAEPVEPEDDDEVPTSVSNAAKGVKIMRMIRHWSTKASIEDVIEMSEFMIDILEKKREREGL